MKKFIILGVLLITVFSLCACQNEKIITDEFFVVIKSDYREKFEAEEFTVDDFEWDNIAKIVYRQWYDESNHGYISIYLKKTGRNRILKAMKHCKLLDFVEYTESIGYTTTH